MSIAGGFHRAVERAVEVEATALQIFVKSARQWKAAPLLAEATAEFRRATVAAGLTDHLLAHASYLINMASPKAELRKRSQDALAVEVERCAARHTETVLVDHAGGTVHKVEDIYQAIMEAAHG